MGSLKRIATTAAATIALTALVSSASSAECTSVGAIGTGFNESIAKFMADAGLKNIIDNRGMKAEGPTKYKCDAGAIVTECSARRRACK